MNLNTISLPVYVSSPMKVAKLAILMVEYALYHLNLDTGISLHTVNECALLSLTYYKKYLMKIIHGKNR
jgi:hypothetical protein